MILCGEMITFAAKLSFNPQQSSMNKKTLLIVAVSILVIAIIRYYLFIIGRETDQPRISSRIPARERRSGK